MSIFPANRVPDILKRMDLNASQAEAMKTCFGILAIMSREDVNKAMIAKDGMEIILNAMTIHVDRTDVQESGCDLLWSLAFNSSIVKDIIAKHGGSNVLVRALKRHSRSADFLKSACGALSNMCQSKLNQEGVASQGGLQPLVGSIHVHQTNPKLLPFIFDAIASIIVNNEENARSVSSLGLVPVVVASLSRHKGSMEVVKSGCHALAILSDVKGQASKIAFAGGVPIILSLLDIHPLYADLHRVAAVVLLRMLQESAHVGREIANHDGIRILLTSLEKGGAQTDTVAAVTHILYTVTNPSSAIGSIIEPQLWATRTVSIEEELLVGRRGKVTVESGYSDGGVGHITSLGGVVSVLGEFSSRRDVVRAACRLLTNLSSFPHVVTALDRLGVLDRMLECVSLHRDTKDVLESTASFLKYIHRQAIPLLSGQRAASVHGLLHVMRVKAHDEDIATACVDTAAKLIEASNRAPLEKRREYDEARQLEGSSYEYHALSVGIGLLTSLADADKDEAGSGGGKGASGTAAAVGAQASPQQVAAPKLTWGKNPCRLISSVLSLIEAVQQTHKLTSDPIMHKDASTALSAVLRVLKQQQVQQKTVDLSKRIERLLPSLEYPPRSQSSPNLRRQLSFKPAQQLPFANPEDSLSNGFLFNGSQARLHSSSSRSSEAPLDEQLPFVEGAAGKASASSSSAPSQLSTSDSFPSAGADVAAPKRMKTGDGYKAAAAAASRLLPPDAESAADKRPVVTVSTAASSSSCNRPQHPLKDKDKGGGKLLLDTWPNYLERLSVSSNPLTAANRSFLNASGESTPSRMHLSYEGGSAAGLGLFSRVPTPVPYVVPSSGLGEPFAHSLTFDSEFESGNLLRAVQRGDQHYDLFLRSDLHTPGHTQWFYFAVGNTHSEELVRLSKEGVSIPPVRVRFNIVNFTKPDSLFNLGMRPVLYSVMDADSKGAGWVRAGSDISYYPNTFIRSNSAGEGLQCYYTLTFTIDFLNPKDTVLIAYSYPYTYTDYRSQLRDILARPHSTDVIRQFKLCPSLAGNDCDLLVITNYRDKDKERIGAISVQSLQDTSSSGGGRDDSGGQQAAAATAGLFSKRRKDKPAPLPLKPGLVLSCRVHPGETPASWMMKGMLEFLTSDCSQAVLLRQVFVIFIVPMLNPDGVIYGNNRCSLSGVDLNRQWKAPVKALHPPVYHLKAFMQAQKKMGRDISMYIDLHGHSRKYNVFMYGVDDKRKPRPQVRAFPKFFSMHEVGKKYVCYADCSFAAKKGRESTARVVVSKELNIPCSFTLEATFCGSNYGPLKHCHMNTGHMQEVGTALCDAILNFSISEGQVKDALLVQVPPNILKAVQLVERAIAAEGCYPDDELLHGSVSEGAGMGVIELTRSTGSCQGRKAILADDSHHVAAAAVAAAESKDKDKQQAFDGEELTGAEVEAPLDSASEDAASDEGSDAESLATIDQPMAKGAETVPGLTAGIASLSSQQRLVLHEGGALTMTMLTTPSPPPVGCSSSSPFKQHQQGGSPLTGISSLGSAHLLAAIQPAHLHLPSFNSAADADRVGKPLLHQGSSSLIQAGAKDDSAEDGLADHHPYDGNYECADDDSDEEAQLQYAAEDSNALATTGQSAVLFRKSKKSKKKKPASANKDAKTQKTLPFLSINGTSKKKEDAAQQKKPLSAGAAAAAVGAMTSSRDDLEVDETAQLLLKARLGKSVGGSSGSTIVKADFNKDELFFHGQQGAGSDSSNHLSTLLVTAAGVGSDENVAITLSKAAATTYGLPKLGNTK